MTTNWMKAFTRSVVTNRSKEAVCSAATLVLLLGAAATAQAQVPGPPNAKDVSPTTNAEVSTTISTGGGYDAWTGSARRTIEDLEVPGAVSNQGLNFARTYSSSITHLWTFAYSWRIYGKPFVGGDTRWLVVFPDGRQSGFSLSTIAGETAYRAGSGTKERLFSSGGTTSGTIDLYLEDGSVVHFSRSSGLDGLDQHPVDYVTPEYVTDPFGRRTILTYSFYGTNQDSQIRLTKVTDEESQKSITIEYEGESAFYIKKVTGSDEQVADYSWSNVTMSNGTTAKMLTGVSYSDGTSANYTYDVATFNDPKNGPDYTLPKLMTASDTRASGPMRSIRYAYKNLANFQGQIASEQHISGIVVSSFASTSYPDTQSATHIETRGDGAFTRSFYMNKANGGVRLITTSDFSGYSATFGYDGQNRLLTAKDHRNFTTTYTNEPILARPTLIEHPAPDTTSFRYTYTDTANPYYVWKARDENLSETIYTRDPVTHQITRIDYPDGAYETFTYNSSGQVTRHQRKANATTSQLAYDHAKYDADGQLVTLWNATTNPNRPAVGAADDIKTTLIYYPAGHAWEGRVKQVTDQLSQATTYEYDRSGGLPCPGRGLVTKIVYADGKYKSFGYDAWGNKLWEENELRKRTTYTYDNYNRLTAVKLPNTIDVPNQSATTYDYTATSGASPYSHTTKSIRKTTSPTGIITGQTFDAEFRVAKKIEAEGTAAAATSRFGYDPNGNETTVTDPRGASLGAVNYSTTAQYDSRDRKTRSIAPAPFNYFTDWGYDGVGNVLKLTHDASGADETSEVKTYDKMNRVLTEKVVPDSRLRVTNLAYWPSGMLKKVTDAENHVTDFAYWPSDLKKTMTYHNGDTQSFAYDDALNLISRKTAANNYQVFEYDLRNRKISMGWHATPDPNSADISWATGVYKCTYVYDDAGRLINANNATSNVIRGYDAAGRLQFGRVFRQSGTKRCSMTTMVTAK